MDCTMKSSRPMAALSLDVTEWPFLSKECQDNTEGDRSERCKAGFFGDATSGTRNDCRPCPCPLTIAPNQCAEGYTGEPTQPGGSCTRSDIDKRPQVVVSPVRVEEPEGSTAVFQNVKAVDFPYPEGNLNGITFGFFSSEIEEGECIEKNNKDWQKFTKFTKKTITVC